MNCFQPGHRLWMERRVLSCRLLLLPLRGRGSYDYVTDADQKILDWWFKSIVPGKVESAIRSSSQSGFGIVGFLPLLGLWFSL